jgi:hypothetical protein
MTKETIISLANKGGWVTSKEYECFADLDGTHAKEFLENKGFTVAFNKDTGYNGIAVTTCGIHLSTNGYMYKKKF